ncbi:MAG: hypothetical protein A2W99_07675 [Bacteroidetes bacterium GWF2_33_16]|nr:MAG: hypothetical protein A2X00_10730 [Bacteroidetes bacterium GWE2_32_14]OFY03655.1 MAG: hypothetical protein A2W99_07675 [Bacteroidetes bacterium GWF2_33_16]
MKWNLILVLLLFLSLSLSCSKKEVNTSEVDQMIKITDSLLQEMSAYQIQFIDSVYHLSGKKLIGISPNGRISQKDSLDFYQLLQEISRKLSDIYQYSHKEILFSHYQLESIKEDIIIKGEITPEIEEDILTEADVLLLLEQRVDSSILLMDESINQIYKFLGDTLTLTLLSDSIK